MIFADLHHVPSLHIYLAKPNTMYFPLSIHILKNLVAFDARFCRIVSWQFYKRCRVYQFILSWSTALLALLVRLGFFVFERYITFTEVFVKDYVNYRRHPIFYEHFQQRMYYSVHLISNLAGQLSATRASIYNDSIERMRGTSSLVAGSMYSAGRQAIYIRDILVTTYALEHFLFLAQQQDICLSNMGYFISYCMIGSGRHIPPVDVLRPIRIGIT